MAKQIRYFSCDAGHYYESDLSESNFKKLCNKFKTGKAVCPLCKPENKPMVPCEDPRSKFDEGKRFSCRHGHVTVVSLFANGICNVSWGDDNRQFENFESGDKVLGMIDNRILKCRHVIEKEKKFRECKCILKSVDNSELKAPGTLMFKTRVRVGDVWDKAGCPEPKDAAMKVVNKHGEEDVEYVQTEFSKRQRQRVRKMRSKQPSKLPGTIINKPTDRSYRSNQDKKPTRREIRGD